MISGTILSLAVVGLASASFSTTENLRRTNYTYKRNRRLSQELIAGYEPTSQVTDFNAIDLDQFYIEKELALDTEEGFDNAFRIYYEGAYSKSVAEITLKSPLPDTIVVEKGGQVRGETASGDSVIAFFLEDYAAGETAIGIRYMTSDSQETYVSCQVGASPEPNTEGCLASSGTLVFSVKRIELPYTYDPLVDNVAKRSISSFSLNANEKMVRCENCPHEMFKIFLDYYGLPEYGDEIIAAAFESKQTDFGNFNNDFRLFSRKARGEIIKIATANIVVWMEVIRQMEDAIDDCQSACTFESCNDDPVQSVDVAVALYTGSLEGIDGSGSGVLSYDLADEMCRDFKTCGDSADNTEGTSKVNIEIFENFVTMQNKLANGECASSRIEKESIETLMLIPLIQGTLKSAYIKASPAQNELSDARGVGFALAVLPAIYNCDPIAESVIAASMIAGVRKESVDFATVKAAFESTYGCLGIDPAMVGGFYDIDIGTYFEGAEPSTMITTEETAVPTVAPTTPAPSISANPTEAPKIDTNSTSNSTDLEPSGNGTIATESPTTSAPTTPAPSISVAPTEGAPAVPTIDSNSTSDNSNVNSTEPSVPSDDETPPTPAPSTPAPSTSVAPTEATPQSLNPVSLGPTVQRDVRSPTPSPTILSAAPTVDAPTEAPELRSATIVDLIMGPTPQLEKLGNLPTPAALKYTSTNIQRPSENRLPMR